MSWWYRFCRNAARIGLCALWQVRAFGREHVPPGGGVILASNHQSYLDPILIGAVMDREVHYMARTSLFRIPALGALIVTLNAFPIQRDTSDVKGVKTALARLQAGKVLLVFPEGTRTRDGHVAPMKSGIRLLAERAAVPVVPVLVEGAYSVWPRLRRFPGPGQINVLFGPAVPLAGDGFGERLRVAVRSLHERPHRRLQRSI
jgi:1-acyl-sn-glycerol-3-phosphate acyltransferase